MSLFSCPQCDEVLCECGYAYRAYRTVEHLEKIRDVIQQVIDARRAGKVWCVMCDKPMDRRTGRNLCPKCEARFSSNNKEFQKEGQ